MSKSQWRVIFLTTANRAHFTWGQKTARGQRGEKWGGGGNLKGRNNGFFEICPVRGQMRMASAQCNTLQAIALCWHFAENGGASCFCCRLSYSRLRFYILCFYMAEQGVQTEFPFLQTG